MHNKPDVWPSFVDFPPLPGHHLHEGRYVILEPLTAAHIQGLWAATAGADSSWDHLRFGPFSSKDLFARTLRELMTREGQPFWAIRPKGGDEAQGWLSYCDISQRDQSIEVGQIWFSPVLQRTRAATEAVYLLMDHAFSELGYRRVVWRCSANNLASLRAAERFGFRAEGIWRGGAYIKGQICDVAWHAILRHEWPARRNAFEAWLHPSNFDPAGHELHSLAGTRPCDSPK
ncbi:GNAT family protein [Iodidimonas sp. SYSU 1G8]|uniref:GNAT family N-acetyltransferase n=1 Tax=Iodidimonas sp. SYSU 1G8 TaxID=3133967 RepID=UPI0031FEA764